MTQSNPTATPEQDGTPPTTIQPNSTYDLLARDIAYLTSDSLYNPEEVAASYDLTLDEYTALASTPAFKERLAYHTSSIPKEDNGLIRARAKLMASSLLRSTFEIANDTRAKHSDRLKAAAMIAELADIKPKNEQQFSGMVLNVSFGSGTPTTTIVAPEDKEVVEHE